MHVGAFLMVLLFKITLKSSAEVLSSVPRSKKTVMHYTEKVLVLDKLCSGMNYNAFGHE